MMWVALSLLLLLCVLCAADDSAGSALLAWQLRFSQIMRNSSYQWREPHKYYYPTLESKLELILHDKCKRSFRVMPANASLSVPRTRDEVFVFPVPPSDELRAFWRAMPRPRQMRVDPFLCEAARVKKRPIFNNTGCQLPHYMHASAPRCQPSQLRWVCGEASLPIDSARGNGFALPEAEHATWFDPPTPWLLSVREATVTMCGQISASCGLIHTTANCMSTGQRLQSQQFRRKCPLSNVQPYINSSAVLREGDITKCPSAPFNDEVHHYERVFVVAEVDDTYIYHIHLEIVPRIVQHLQFLRENRDIKILIGCDSKDKHRGTKEGPLTAHGLRAGMKAVRLIMRLFDFPADRFVVHQNVFAREVYLPMEGGCQDPVYNTWQILDMRRRILSSLQIPTGYRTSFFASNHSDHYAKAKTGDDYKETEKGNKPVLLLLKRSSNSQHTRNRFDLVRQWSDSFTDRLLSALQTSFPQYDMQLFSDRNGSLMDCFACQVRLVAGADVLVGVHGAGLGMSLYMPPNKAVVELAPYGNDGRCLLGGGPFSRLAAVMAHNYMMHHPPYEEFKWMTGKSSEFNITRFVSHIHSFLASIGELRRS